MPYHSLLPLSSLLNANAQTQRTLFTLIPLNARNENQYAVQYTCGVAGITRVHTIKHQLLLRSSKKPQSAYAQRKRLHKAGAQLSQQRTPRESVSLAWNTTRNRLRATPLTEPHNMHDRQKALKTASPSAVRHALLVMHLTRCKLNAQQMPLADTLHLLRITRSPQIHPNVR